MGDMTQKIKYPSNDYAASVDLILFDCCCRRSCQFYFRFHINFIANMPFMLIIMRQPNILCAKMEHRHFQIEGNGVFFANEFLKCFDSILLISSGNFFIGKKLLRLILLSSLDRKGNFAHINSYYIHQNKGKKSERERECTLFKTSAYLKKRVFFLLTILTVLNPFGIKMFAYNFFKVL